MQDGQLGHMYTPLHGQKLPYPQPSLPTVAHLRLNRNPNQHNHNIHTLPFPTIILERPHAILLLIPVRARSAVHPATTNVRLSIRGGRLRARRHMGLLLLELAPAARLVEGRGGDEVLDDGAVAGELVLRRGAG